MLTARRSIYALTLVVCNAAGCTGWRQVHEGMPAALERKPRELRITKADSSRIVVKAPALVGDTVVGAGNETRVPTAAIVRVETRGLDGSNTAALIGGVGLLVVVGVIAAQSAVENGLGEAPGR